MICHLWNWKCDRSSNFVPSKCLISWEQVIACNNPPPINAIHVQYMYMDIYVHLCLLYSAYQCRKYRTNTTTIRWLITLNIVKWGGVWNKIKLWNTHHPHGFIPGPNLSLLFNFKFIYCIVKFSLLIYITFQILSPDVKLNYRMYGCATSRGEVIFNLSFQH